MNLPSRRRILTLLLAAGAALASLAAGADTPPPAAPAAAAPAAPASSPPPVPAAGPVVTLETSLGRIVLELDEKAAPRTVANFLRYVKEGFYDGTVFHRVIPGFMIQGGGFTGGLQLKATHGPIAIESNNGLHNQRATVAMARTADPDSATSQFFINVVDNAFLDYPGRDGAGYTVFARVIDGMDVVDRIVGLPTEPRRMPSGVFPNLPQQPVVIEKARLGAP